MFLKIGLGCSTHNKTIKVEAREKARLWKRLLIALDEANSGGLE